MCWKVNGPKYPILQEIARDVLGIPLTSVASESTFSSGGCLLDPHHSRLHHDTVEALMCTQSWLHNNHNQDSDGSTSISECMESCFSIEEGLDETEDDVTDPENGENQ